MFEKNGKSKMTTKEKNKFMYLDFFMALGDIVLVIGFMIVNYIIPLLATILYLTVFIASVAVFSKPSRESFDAYFSNFVNEIKATECNRLRNNESGGYFSSLFQSSIVTLEFKEWQKTSTKMTVDFGVIKVVTVNSSTRDDKIVFVGAFNGWYPLLNRD